MFDSNSLFVIKEFKLVKGKILLYKNMTSLIFIFKWLLNGY